MKTEERKKEGIAAMFADDVFTDAVMKARLPKRTYDAYQKVVKDGGDLDPATADKIAEAMKEWAIEKGATHYTHWFEPLTGTTAEKHDAFLGRPEKDGTVLMQLSGKELIKGEPDASSFPSGGLRATFEARGYTIWDISSPAFVRHDETGAILYIPTAFCSYTGEALDQKTPLLRSMQAIDKQAVRLLRLFGNRKVRHVYPMVGAEQEYFIIDREKYLLREDLIITGRTLFGALPPKGQELDDHYYGTIRPRIAAFMKEVNEELWRLGVPAKTQHNEVAPAQHELAAVYEIANVAVDHNQTIMRTLKRVATRHGLRCLLHEKPFEGVNGSGKHNNWSLLTDDGMNLMDPGKTPHENAQFLLILACILKAVDRHSGLLRESASDVGSDLRLGVNEAPPAILSVFIGEQLEDVLEQLMNQGGANRSKRGGLLKTGVNILADISRDATDRNRTSPFAFTGNKFEFRMPGSRDSIAGVNTVLNTIVADAFAKACDELEGSANFEKDLYELIRRYTAEHQRIIFNGNGYSDEWKREAKKRGLPELPTMVDAIPALTEKESIRLFEEQGVLTRSELESRAEIKYEAYAKAILIEAKTMLDLTGKAYLPAIMYYAGDLAQRIGALEAVHADASVLRSVLTGLLKEQKKAEKAFRKLQKETASIEALDDWKEKAESCRDRLLPGMASLRAPVDACEGMVDREIWPVPSYTDLVFEV